MKRSDWILLLAGLALFGFAIFQIQVAERDLAIIQLPHLKPPTTALLALINALGINTKRTLGLIVGGYLLTWFSLAGLIGLSMLKFRIPPPSRRSIAGGVFDF